MACGICMSLLLRPLFEAQLAAMTAPEPGLPDGVFGYLALFYAIFTVMFIVLFAAAFRAVLSPVQARAAYLRLGMDELRLLGLMLVLFVGLWLAMVAAGIVAMIIALVLALVMGKGAVLLFAGLACAGLFGGLIYLTVRFSIAAPLTVLRGRLALAEAWNLTKGHFWAMFGAYICIALIISVPFLIFVVMMAGGFYHHIVEAPYDPAAFSAAMHEQLALQAPGKPLWFIGVIGGALLGGIAIALQGAMTAIAARELLAQRATGA